MTDRDKVVDQIARRLSALNSDGEAFTRDWHPWRHDAMLALDIAAEQIAQAIQRIYITGGVTGVDGMSPLEAAQMMRDEAEAVARRFREDSDD